MNYKILMVDDDRELLKMLNQYFTLKNYTVIIAENGIEAMEKISANPDIILLDVNMPGMDGIEVCRRIRDMVSCPIIFLTAKVEEQDRVMGLLSGGDDYVLKPFSLKELDARIIAHLKREERLHRKKEQRFYGELVIDYASKCVHIKGNALELTKLEYEIIEFLSMNPEMVFDKERIYEKIGGYDAEGDSRVVTELIRRIRKKMKMYSGMFGNRTGYKGLQSGRRLSSQIGRKDGCCGKSTDFIRNDNGKSADNRPDVFTARFGNGDCSR